MVGTKMTNAPVYFTLAQVRHNPILSLDSFVPGIQESLRKVGYPDFHRDMAVVFNLGNLAPAVGGDMQKQPEPLRLERFTFSNMERTRGFILDQNSLSFQSTDYDTFESFSGAFLMGMEIVHKEISFGFSERVGIRYLDAVIPEGGEKELKKYLVQEVLGLANRLGEDARVLHSFSETQIRTLVGNVLSRTIIQNGSLGFPPDLQPIGLEVADHFKKIGGVHAIIDTDGSFEGREPFDPGALRGRLHALHDEITKVFQATVTEHALNNWK
ncbi:MAG: TIGR04255 family protein [Burkholderiales bacterium]